MNSTTAFCSYKFVVNDAYPTSVVLFTYIGRRGLGSADLVHHVPPPLIPIIILPPVPERVRYTYLCCDYGACCCIQLAQRAGMTRSACAAGLPRRAHARLTIPGGSPRKQRIAFVPARLYPRLRLPPAAYLPLLFCRIYDAGAACTTSPGPRDYQAAV